MAFFSGGPDHRAFFLSPGCSVVPAWAAGFGPGRDPPRRACRRQSWSAKTKTRQDKIQDKANWRASRVTDLGSLGRSALYVSGQKATASCAELAVAFSRQEATIGFAAIHLALRSGDRSVLPFLRRGRLDSDPRWRPLARRGAGFRSVASPCAQPLPLFGPPPNWGGRPRKCPATGRSADPALRDRWRPFCSRQQAEARTNWTRPGDGRETGPPQQRAGCDIGIRRSAFRPIKTRLITSRNSQ